MTNKNLNEKRKLFLNMQEHPENYTERQITELLADEDVKAFAHQMAMAKRAMLHNEPLEVSVDKAWQQFAKSSHTAERRWAKIAASAAGIIFLSGIALAAVIRLSFFAPAPSPQQPEATARAVQPEATDTAAVRSDTPQDSTAIVPVTFENAELSTILAQMGAFYHADVVFQNEQARHVRLYFKWDKQQTIQHQTELLNAFDRISISLENNTLTVE